MGFNLADYEEVKDRLPRFWKEHPAGGIRTTRLDSAPGEWVVHAALYRAGESEPFATGLAHEIAGQKGVNATSALENCETSAIGRALANGGFSSGKNRPSREEMGKVERGKAAKPQESVQDAPGREIPETLADCKRMVLAAVQAAQPAWTPTMVKDTCKRLWDAALLAGPTPPEPANAAVIAGAILDLAAAEG